MNITIKVNTGKGGEVEEFSADYLDVDNIDEVTSRVLEQHNETFGPTTFTRRLRALHEETGEVIMANNSEELRGELGDALGILLCIIEQSGIKPSVLMNEHIEKLHKRHKSGYYKKNPHKL